MADHKVLLVCQLPASINQSANNEDETIPRCFGEYLTLLLIFLVATLVLAISLCFFVVISILWLNAEFCPIEDLGENKRDNILVHTRES